MYFKITGIKRQVLICSVMYLGQICIGFYIVWPAPVMPILQNPAQSPVPYNLTDAQLSFMATLVLLASIPAPYACGWLSNRFGRKPCLIAGGVFMIIGSVILLAAKNIAMLYCGRFGLGIGGGIVNVISVLYIGEIASINIRGILLAGMGLFLTCGSLFLFPAAPFLSYFGITSVGLGLSIVFTLSTLMLTETPIFFILKGDDCKVKEVLEDLGRLEDVDSLLAAKTEYTETNSKKDWKELLTIKSNRRALFILLVINILQNCSGLTAVITFSGSIFEMAGSSINANTSMLIVTAFQLLGSILTPFCIERIGRKTILMISCAACCVIMFFLGLYFYLNYIESPVINNLKWLPLVIIILYFISYNFGYGVIPNTIIGEMFTTNVRSIGSSVTLSVSWTFGFIVNTAFGVILKIVGGHSLFWFFSVICACAFIFTIFFVPETKGKSLLEIQERLSK